MTAVLAMPVGRRWLLGADRALTDEHGAYTQGGPKLVQVSGMLLAVAGALGGWWERVPTLDAANPWELLQSLGSGHDAEVLIARKEHLYSGYWSENEERWACAEIFGVTGIGSGAAWGVGALLTGARPRTKEAAKRRMLEALAISETCCSQVRKPFDLAFSS